MEDRFGSSQVASVGTVTTFKAKGMIKDFDRQLDNDIMRANVITSIVEADDSVKDIFKRSVSEPKLKSYIKDNPDIFYMMDNIMDQNKTQSIHACATIVFPNIMEAQEYVPVRKQKGLIVTEWNGTELDNAGFLKCDILGIKQLSKYKAILKLIEKNHNEKVDIYKLPLDDTEVFTF